MGIIVEPSLHCDECNRQILPGEPFVNLYSATFLRVETPAFEAAYADYEKVKADVYLHTGACLQEAMEGSLELAEEHRVREAWERVFAGEVAKRGSGAGCGL